MSRLLISILAFVVAFHLAAFVGEVFLWMNPSVHGFSLNKLNVPVDVGLLEQALILKTLFVNQGFYNLFVALGGVLGFLLFTRGREQQGIALLAYMSLFALGAGVVLLLTTVAYIASALQAIPGLLALLLMHKNGLFQGRR